MDKVKEVAAEYGSYLFKLEQLLFDRGISINQLMRDTNTDYKVIKRLRDGDLVRLDFMILDRFCHYLKCEISDIVEYRPYP